MWRPHRGAQRQGDNDRRMVFSFVPLPMSPKACNSSIVSFRALFFDLFGLGCACCTPWLLLLRLNDPPLVAAPSITIAG